MTIVNNQTSIQFAMYMFGPGTSPWLNVPVDVQDNTTKQYETNYTFQVQLAGDYKLFFLLYLDHEPVLPDYPMIPYTTTRVHSNVPHNRCDEQQSDEPQSAT